MANLNQYRASIETLLKEYAQLSKSSTGVETQLIFDRERDHYLLNYVGWQQEQYIYGPALQFDLKEGKVWFQYNGLMNLSPWEWQNKILSLGFIRPI